MTSQPKISAARSTAPLPWVLVGILTAVSLALTGVLIVQTNELNHLKAAKPSASASAAAPTQQAPAQQAPAKPQLPQPLTDKAALDLVKSLRRLDKADPLAIGPVNAPVVMITWSDFRCPFCSAWEAKTLPKLMPYVKDGTLRIEHRDLVLFGDDSMRAAMAGRAAGAQGKFWDFAAAIAHAAPNSGHPPISEADVLAFAKEAGIKDLAKFKADLTSKTFKDQIEKDIKEAQKIGISGTPFFIVGNTPINGALPTDVFIAVIEASKK